MVGAGGGSDTGVDTVLWTAGTRTDQPRTGAGFGGSEGAARNLSIRCMGRAACRTAQMTPATAPPPR